MKGIDERNDTEWRQRQNDMAPIYPSGRLDPESAPEYRISIITPGVCQIVCVIASHTYTNSSTNGHLLSRFFILHP